MQSKHVVAQTAVKENLQSLAHVGNREVVIETIIAENDGLLLKICSKQMRADREVVLAAVQMNRKALQHAELYLQYDEKLRNEPCRVPGTNAQEVCLLEDAESISDIATL